MLAHRGDELRLATTDGEPVARAPCPRTPAFAADLPAGPLRDAPPQGPLEEAYLRARLEPALAAALTSARDRAERLGGRLEARPAEAGRLHLALSLLPDRRGDARPPLAARGA